VDAGRPGRHDPLVDRLEARRRRTLEAVAAAYDARLIDTRSMELRVEAALSAGTAAALERPRAGLPEDAAWTREVVGGVRWIAGLLAGEAPVVREHAWIDLTALAASGPEGRWTLGRSSRCDLRIEGSPMVSRVHCELVLRGGRWYVNDLSSTYGTYLGARRIVSAPLGRLLPVTLADVRLSWHGR
jgi:hypothetical protein